MKKTSKIIICALTITLTVLSFTLPCLCAGVYPTQSNTLTGRKTLQAYPSDVGWTYDNCVAVAEIVEKAYKLNYFASAIPIAVFSVGNSAGSSIAVLAVPYFYFTNLGLPIRAPQTSPDYEGDVPPAIGTSRNDIIGTVTSNSYIKATNAQTGEEYPMILYFMNEENTFFPSNAGPFLERYEPERPNYTEYSMALNMTDSYQVSTTNILAIRYGENDWRTPYAVGYSDVAPSIASVNEWYDDQLTQTQRIVNYELNVPAIITAIPNGAKQIINNAFGFELFGINVAGLLTAIIVIALVAFFVKWLMSR